MNTGAGAGAPDPADPASSSGGDPVGSLGEEAAKLFGALSHWAREQEPDADPDADPGADGGPEHRARTMGADAFEAATHTLHGLAESVRRVDEHIATGDAECRYCPLCRVIHAVRRTSPEVRQHLGTAAGALLEAATALLADVPASVRPDAGGDDGDEPGPDQRR